MSNIDMGLHGRYPGESEGLNNWIARETTRVPISRYSRSHAAAHETSAAAPGRTASLYRSANERDPEGRRVEKSGFHMWPLLKSKSTRVNVGGGLLAATQTQGTSTAAPELKATSPPMAWQANAQPRKLEFLRSNKRKVSVPDISPGRMTTVQECLLDSPTLPIHHPFLQRALSYPEVGLRRLSDAGNEHTPGVSDFSPADRVQPPAALEKRKSWEKLGRMRSSVIMQKELLPLMIPAYSPVQSAQCAYRKSPSIEVDETPPQVPPKSPRTESRASPRPKQIAHSASSSTSTLHSMSSSATSVSSVSGKASPQNPHHPYRAGSPVPQRSGPIHGEGQSPGLSVRSLDRFGRYTPPCSPLGRPRPVGTSMRQDRAGSRTPPLVRSSSSDPETLTESEQYSTLGWTANPNRMGSSGRERKREEAVKEEIVVGQVTSGKLIWHQRGASEASILDPYRSTTRGDSFLVRKLSKAALRGPSLSEDRSWLPTGFPVKQVSGKLLDSDLKLLKEQADERIKGFEVLSVQDVSNLSKELSLLNERCEYLHRTHQSLRRGRVSLHSRMILYLKTPHLTKFSRESILKQEEALAELDFSIDDWVSKLERAQDRRDQIQQKLLEHFAAASNLQMSPTTEVVPAIDMMQAPTATAESSEDFYSRQRHDVQSIKVYADSGVAALLAAIEQEIGIKDVPTLSFPSHPRE